MKKLNKLSLLAGIIITFAFAGCNQPREGAVDNENDSTMQSDNMQHSMDMSVNKAVAVIHSGTTDVSGWITFTKAGDGVHVQAELTGLSDKKHGFHIHMYGDCSAEDYSSAGGHYNPAHEAHGAPTDSVRHMGDMGNITANGDSATLDYTDSTIQISKIVGRAIIVHEGTDDLTSQPSGAAGARIACGVIGYANPSFMSDEMDSDGNNM